VTDPAVPAGAIGSRVAWRPWVWGGAVLLMLVLGLLLLWRQGASAELNPADALRFE